MKKILFVLAAILFVGCSTNPNFDELNDSEEVTSTSEAPTEEPDTPTIEDSTSEVSTTEELIPETPVQEPEVEAPTETPITIPEQEISEEEIPAEEYETPTFIPVALGFGFTGTFDWAEGEDLSFSSIELKETSVVFSGTEFFCVKRGTSWYLLTDGTQFYTFQVRVSTVGSRRYLHIRAVDADLFDQCPNPNWNNLLGKPGTFSERTTTSGSVSQPIVEPVDLSWDVWFGTKVHVVRTSTGEWSVNGTSVSPRDATPDSVTFYAGPGCSWKLTIPTSSPDRFQVWNASGDLIDTILDEEGSLRQIRSNFASLLKRVN